MKGRLKGVLSCLGAIIGAGFVSGREVVSFFSRYGGHSWWLIGLSVVTMVLLCRLCMHAMQDGEAEPLCSGSMLGRVCLMGVLFVLAGSMTAAAGHMVSLAIPVKAAYLFGIVGTLCIAWLLGKGSMKPYSVLSSVLTALFLGMILLAMGSSPVQTVHRTAASSAGELVRAALYAVGYGAMNIAVSMGVVCRSGQCCPRDRNRKSLILGLLLGALLFVSNALYLRNPQVMDKEFPIVTFFTDFGRMGYIGCLALLYLAILTTLIALVLVLRGGIELTSLPVKAVMPLTLGIPAVISCIGFTQIVDHLYAPAGLFCLVILFLPMIGRQRQKRS